jgi:hypothetical protein
LGLSINIGYNLPVKHKKGIHFHDCLSADVGSTGEMSNQIWDDLVNIYQVAMKLNK